MFPMKTGERMKMYNKVEYILKKCTTVQLRDLRFNLDEDQLELGVFLKSNDLYEQLRYCHDTEH